jgi:hypothetical protein
MGKYADLVRLLDAQPERPPVRLTFQLISDALNGGLPASAYRHQAWWANETNGRHVQATAWMSAGWAVDCVDLDLQTVMFRRTVDRRG